MATKAEENFADVIRELVETHGTGQQRELARRGDVSHTYLNHWIRGRRPTPRMLRHFADSLSLGEETRSRLYKAAGYVEGAWNKVGSWGRASEDAASASNAERLTAHIADLARRYPEIPNLTISLQGGLGRLHELSEEEMGRLLASVTRNAERLAEKKRSKQTETQS